MNPTGHNPNDPRSERRARFEELMLDRAMGELDASGQSELQLLAHELGCDIDDRFEIAQAAALVAMTTPIEPPASLKAQLQATGRMWAANLQAAAQRDHEASYDVLSGREDDDRAMILDVSNTGSRGLRAPSRGEKFTYKIMAYSGWLAAAACVALMLTYYAGRPGKNDLALVNVTPPGPVTEKDRALERLQKIMSDPSAQAVVVDLAENRTSEGPPAPLGQVVWSNNDSQGVLVLKNLPPIERPGDTYQLWVVDALRDERFPVDAGTFSVEPGKRELVMPINSKLPVSYPRAFAITIERAGGNVVATGTPVATGAPVAGDEQTVPAEQGPPEERPMRSSAPAEVIERED